MKFKNVNELKMWEQCMELLMEVERQWGMEKVRKVARQLFEAKLLDARTYQLLLFDNIRDII